MATTQHSSHRRHFACSILKSEFPRRMAAFGWMMAILSLIFDANASAGGSAVSRMSSEGTDVTLDRHLRFVRNPRDRKFVGVSAGHHIPLGHRDDHRGHRHHCPSTPRSLWRVCDDCPILRRIEQRAPSLLCFPRWRRRAAKARSTGCLVGGSR
jgi:hypothetical protein